MSCSAASWRILAEGVIAGLGGCRIASWPSVFYSAEGCESWVERDVLMALDADPGVEAVAS
jgi:hypothetical protein